MSLINNFDNTCNFWKSNPQLQLLPLMGKFRNEDKSKDKSYSSTVMWGIAFLLEQSKENKFKNLSEDDRKQLITKEIIKDKNFKWKDVEDIIIEYKNLAMTAAERALLDWNKYMDERSKVIEQMPLTIDNIEKIDKLMLNNKKLFEDLKRIQDEFTKEGAKTSTKGGGRQSVSDTGDI